MSLSPDPPADRARGEPPLRAIIDAALDAVIVMNQEGEIVEWNAAAENVFRWRRDEVLGDVLAERIIPPGLRSAHHQGLRHYLRTGEGPVLGRRLELTAVRKGGEEFPVELSIAELPGGEGRFFIGFIRDITERRAVEKALSESERKHRFFAEFAEATYTLATPREALTSAARLLGKYLGASRCAYGEVEGEFVRIADQYTDGCASQEGEYRLADFGPQVRAELPAGRTLVLRDTHREIADPLERARFDAVGTRALICSPVLKQGVLRGLMAVSQTSPREWEESEIAMVREAAERCWSNLERLLGENALRSAGERFRTLADNISQLAWMSTAEGWLFWYNQRWFEFTGTVASEMEGWGWRKVHHPDHVERVTDKFRVHLASGEAWEDTFPIRGADGGYRWFLSRARPIRNAGSEITLWFGTNTDVTEQRALTEELRAAKEQAEAGARAKDNFLAALSHELRTPLTPVLMSAAALREQEDLPAEVREQLAVIQRNVELEARLIDDLLDLTRVAHDRLPLHLQPCDAHSLIGHAVEIVRQESDGKVQALQLDLGARLSGLSADPARLQQVFWNLLRNAVKFTPREGAIAIRTRDAGPGHLQIVVSDTGLGIRPESLEIIFQPFEQAGLENDHRFGGLGLGLAIVRAIVALHGGTIAVESAGPGLGATFTVELPGAFDPHSGLAPAALRESPPESPRLEPQRALRLLVVEDHEPTLTVLARLLKRAGHEVVTAMTVAEALAAAEQGSFDGVISDLGLPDGTGLDLMRMLRARHGLRGIALSGYGMEEDVRRSSEAGFFMHLIKPIEFGELREGLRRFAEGSAGEAAAPNPTLNLNPNPSAASPGQE